MDTGLRIIRLLIPPIGVIFLLCATAASVQSQPVPQILSPDEAFRLEAVRMSPVRVRLVWTIAPGYYLYRDRFRFETAGGALLPVLEFPSGEPKNDPYFGPTEIFRDRLVIEVGVDSAGNPDGGAGLRVISQGCADLGVCFPPQSAKVNLIAGAASAVSSGDVAAGDESLPAATARDPLAALSDPSGGTEPVALPFLRVRDNGALETMLRVARRRGVPVLLEFYADWCIPCRKLEARTFSARRVRDALGDALLLRADVSANRPEDAALLRRFGLTGPPAVLLFNRSGEEQLRHRVVGFMAAEPFAARVLDAFR